MVALHLQLYNEYKTKLDRPAIQEQVEKIQINSYHRK